MVKRWKLEQLIAALQATRAATERQIAGLLVPVETEEHFVVLAYVLSESGPLAAQAASAQGYTRPGVREPTRQYKAQDVYDLVNAGHPSIPAGLLELARLGKPIRTKGANAGWN